ncbi:MAG: proline--tRNA ligase, partial [Armatimonadota bacterium]|nr:proline--tRNA ligase [Armatimonadota bacterium]
MEAKEAVKEIPRKHESLSEWYTAVCLRAELVDYAPVRGCMVIRPYGWSIWEAIQRWLDGEFRRTGHQTAAFPLFIPESFLKKEAEHVAGFAPQVAWVTHGGDEPLGERLAVRPTSEAIIMPMYAKWIQSYRDLPVRILQWGSVVRWEKSTRLFLRTLEFFWHEGHTAHRTAEEADEECRLILDIYRRLLEGELAIPVLVGKKPASEKFAGAEWTYTLEALMPDGQAIQAGTSHFLGQHFARAFNVKFLDRDNTEKYVWTTSWAVTTRLIGALVLAHGDDRGLFLPPRIAPIQVVIVPIRFEDTPAVLERARALAAQLRERFRVHLDDREEYTPGWKFNEWELRGVPLRIELGPRDLQQEQAVLVARDGEGGKRPVPLGSIEGAVAAELEAVQRRMFERAREFLQTHTLAATSYAEATELIRQRRGFVRVQWCLDQSCEDRLREDTGGFPRVIP